MGKEKEMYFAVDYFGSGKIDSMAQNYFRGKELF